MHWKGHRSSACHPTSASSINLAYSELSITADALE